ncbi:hypothetical protein Lal_00048242 [Lupinus albus]|nr:hypothetical protein Lal_00048242 [Lupinus albus]
MAYVEGGVVKSKRSIWRLKTITDSFWLVVNFITMEKSDAYRKGAASSKKFDGGAPGGGSGGGGGGPYGGGPRGPPRGGLDNVRGLDSIRGRDHNPSLQPDLKPDEVLYKVKLSVRKL